MTDESTFPNSYSTDPLDKYNLLRGSLSYPCSRFGPNPVQKGLVVISYCVPSTSGGTYTTRLFRGRQLFPLKVNQGSDEN